MRLVEEGKARAGRETARKLVIADDIAREARWATESHRVIHTVVTLTKHRGPIWRLDHIGHMAGGGNIGHRQRHPVPARIEYGADEDAGIERHRLARFKVYVAARPGAHLLQEIDQLIALVIGAGDMMPTAEVQPLQARQEPLDPGHERRPGAFERREILLAQRVKVQPRDAFEVRDFQLIDRKAQPRMRRARIVARHFALGVERIDAQTHIERLTRRACRRDLARKARMLAGRVEDHMVRQPQDFRHIRRLVGCTIGGDFALVVLGRQPRFPQARRAYAVEVFADNRRHPPHRERLERGQDLHACSIANIGQNRQIGAQPRHIDHERRAVDAVQIEVRKRPRIAGSRFQFQVLSN